MNAAVQRLLLLRIDVSLPDQAAESGLDMRTRAAEAVVKVEMPEGRIEVVAPEQANHAAAEPDAFGVAGRAVDRLRGLDGPRLITTVAKISLASLVMAVGAYQTERALHVVMGDSTLLQAARVFAAIAVGLVVLAASAQLLRIEEFTENVRLLKSWGRSRR